MEHIIPYSRLSADDADMLPIVKHHAQTYGALMVEADDAPLARALHLLQSMAVPIVRHNPKELYDHHKHVLDDFSLHKGGYVFVHNNSYSHILRFMFLGGETRIVGHEQDSGSLCMQLAEAVRIFTDCTRTVVAMLENIYQLPPQRLLSNFDVSHYFLEYNYYYPVHEGTQIAGAQPVENHFMRMKPHIDLWGITLTIPVISGKNALQFMNAQGEYYHLHFPQQCFFLHFGAALREWAEPHEMPIHVPIHRVVTDAAQQERFSCLIKFTNEERPT